MNKQILLIGSFIFSLFLLCPEDIRAAPKIAIEIEAYTGGARIAETLIYQIKEVISKSNLYKITVNDLPRVIMRIISVSYSDSPDSMVYIVILLSLNNINNNYYPIFINHFAGSCKSYSLFKDAQHIVARMDQEINNYIKINLNR